MIKKIVIGASAGGPDTLKKIFDIKEELKIPVVLAMHNLSSQVENFKDFIEDFTKQKVYIINNITSLNAGIYIPEGGKDIIFVNENTISAVDSQDIIAPSINHLFKSCESFVNDDFYFILLGGLGQDGTNGLKVLEKKNANIYIQKRAKFPYMTNAAMRSLKRYNKLDIEGIKNLILKINRG
ncbi:hypothetical protein XO10_09980 [Marinitoga sp. 1135]|uniref:chemotaxis protein CheB n=1 Tax=Marinitoga sp. 1135 TaxID=1643333 RepID=UPI0015866292|nr:hypothetical protein [Marinitoga sp. 1135]